MNNIIADALAQAEKAIACEAAEGHELGARKGPYRYRPTGETAYERRCRKCGSLILEMIEVEETDEG